MFKNALKIVALVVFVALFAGCSHRLIDYTIISSKNVDLSRTHEYVRGKDRVTGKDMKHVILFIPTGTPNLKEATDRALETVPGAVALVDGVVTAKSIWWVLGGTNGFIVEGSPLIDPELAQATDFESDYMISYHDPDTEEPRLYFVTEAEYAQVKEYIDTGNKKAVESLLFNR